jgi:23S rRNA (pseudouridine1915-N3)-methyltransferase
MTIRILCVGKLKERFYADAMAEFIKRLSRFARVEVAEVADERAPETLSNAQRAQVLEREGARLMEKLRPSDFAVALRVDGRRYSSEAFAGQLGAWMNEGKSSIAFLIGGSLGLSPAALERADAGVSFSDMTFSHQLIRVMLVEQVYRAFKILNNEPYHK